MDYIIENKEKNVFIGLIATVIGTLILSFLYALSILVMEINIVIFPCIGAVFVILFFRSYYLKNKNNIVIETIVMLLASIQAPIAMIMLIMLKMNLSINIYNINAVITRYFEYLNFKSGIYLIIQIIASIWIVFKINSDFRKKEVI